MLVLKRRIGEGILIGGNIKVIILGIEKNRVVKIGIEAPDIVNVVREELVTKENLNVDKRTD